MKRIAILGSTGSIGTQTLDCVRQHPDKLKVVGLAAKQNAELLKAQAKEFGVQHLATFESVDCSIPNGLNAICDLACADEVDTVVVSVAGVIGLKPTIDAIRAGKNIALASKEVLVAAGEVVMPLVQENGVNLTPIDSEHSAIFQCLQGYKPNQIDSLVLTASGGPFRGWTRNELLSITPEQALNHPTWNMGGKITVDSATLMNKALETIEARWLFGVPMSRVEVVVHPESIIHSLVRFTDGSALGQLGWPDMRLPIQYALLYPERPESGLKRWDPVLSGPLHFETYDETVFKGPSLAREAMKLGGTAPCVFNAANEEAANAFLRGEISFLQIQDSVAEVLYDHKPEPCNLESLFEVDAWARRAWKDRFLSFRN